MKYDNNKYMRKSLQVQINSQATHTKLKRAFICDRVFWGQYFASLNENFCANHI